MKRISEKQRRVYDYIISFSKEHGYSPSIREISAGVGLRSPSTVHTHVKSLKEAGVIHKDDKKIRALFPVIKQGIPIIDKLSDFDAEETCEHLSYNTDDNKQYFAVKVQGNFMSGAGIYDGDYLVAHKQESADLNQIVVVLLDDQIAVRRLLEKDGKVCLITDGYFAEMLDASECVIAGKVTAVVRIY